MSMSELAPHSLQLNIRDKYRMSMSDLARHLPQLDIRDFCRMSMSKLARHSSQLDIRDFCRMSVSELAQHTPQFDIRMSNVDRRWQCQLHAAQSVIIRMARVTYMIYCYCLKKQQHYMLV
ncbi:hypothetical protein DPMN_171743 [Dreissena polymorpha]|uniref:Uncharacterized protein n=1 Tax=Dreissena polymorpha TaxID=45954 RepID=A0A9D4E0X3_DREPO|nr:hypothetical protein DPMN_171743 [Dreissena polymorpha]